MFSVLKLYDLGLELSPLQAIGAGLGVGHSQNTHNPSLLSSSALGCKANILASQTPWHLEGMAVEASADQARQLKYLREISGTRSAVTSLRLFIPPSVFLRGGGHEPDAAPCDHEAHR